jgi:hypothetical protein
VFDLPHLQSLMDVNCSRLKGGEQLGNRVKQQITHQELNLKQGKEALEHLHSVWQPTNYSSAGHELTPLQGSLSMKNAICTILPDLDLMA